MRIRRALALSAALTVLAVGLPAASAFSADGKEDCKNVTNGGSQSDPQCFWMADPAEALDIVRFWAKDDGAKLKEAGEYPIGWIDCTVEACSAEGEGDGEAHGEGDPAPEGYQDDNTPPTCQTAGETCSVSPEEIAAAAKTAAGQAIAAAAAGKMRVWVDTELLDDYQAGTAAFAAAVRKVAALAAQPGVVGIRFTSQLGYNGAVKSAEEMSVGRNLTGCIPPLSSPRMIPEDAQPTPLTPAPPKQGKRPGQRPLSPGFRPRVRPTSPPVPPAFDHLSPAPCPLQPISHHLRHTSPPSPREHDPAPAGRRV